MKCHVKCLYALCRTQKQISAQISTAAQFINAQPRPISKDRASYSILSIVSAPASTVCIPSNIISTTNG